MTEGPTDDISRVELIGCTDCDFEMVADETPLFRNILCPECEVGSLEQRFRFPNIERDICNCGRWPVAVNREMGGDSCLECLGETFAPLP